MISLSTKLPSSVAKLMLWFDVSFSILCFLFSFFIVISLCKQCVCARSVQEINFGYGYVYNEGKMNIFDIKYL